MTAGFEELLGTLTSDAETAAYLREAQTPRP
jgi:hypothetical protein